MRSVVTDSTASDFGLSAFLEKLAALSGPDEQPFFAPAVPIVVARAPGRLDVMGGVADYSGSLVLEMPICEAAFAAVQLGAGKALHVISVAQDGSSPRSFLRSDVTAVLSYAEERELLAHAPDGWAGYVFGAFPVLANERGARFGAGARICIDSTVPEGRGVASSAAVEVAAMSAIAGAYGLTLSAREIASLCHLLENEVVGAPCGPMDQMAVALGEESRLLALLCRPAQQLPSVDFPEGVIAVGVDSGEGHSVSAGAYRTARTAAFMGKHIVEQRHGPLEYLTELEPHELRAHEAQLPVAISGADYLDRYGPLTGSVSAVERGERYPVRAAVRHAVEEHRRVREFADLLPGARSEPELERLGTLMDLAHRGYGACGLGSPATAELAAILRRVPGVYGARVTGGGSGGTVAALLQVDAVPLVAEAARGRASKIFSGSSPGADEFGTLEIVLGE
jgi:L-arabinokinase